MTDLLTLDPSAQAQLHSIVASVGSDCTIIYTISDRNYARYVPLLRRQLDSLCPSRGTHFVAVCLDEDTSALCRRQKVDFISPDMEFFARRDRFAGSTARVVADIGRQVGYYKFLMLLELTRRGFATLFTEMDIFIHRDLFLFSQYVVEREACIRDERLVVTKHFLGIPIERPTIF